MQNGGIVQIHGKEYMTVARRLELATTEKALESVETDVLNHNPVVVKAKVTLKGHVFTGISSVSLDSPKLIEKQNPYEVAETSAVGRALGFAGYGLVESVATADDMLRAFAPKEQSKEETAATCEICGGVAVERKGITKGGKNYHGIFCSENKNHVRWLWN